MRPSIHRLARSLAMTQFRAPLSVLALQWPNAHTHTNRQLTVVSKQRAIKCVCVLIFLRCCSHFSQHLDSSRFYILNLRGCPLIAIKFWPHNMIQMLKGDTTNLFSITFNCGSIEFFNI